MIKPLAPQASNSILESLSSDGVQRFVHKKQKITLPLSLQLHDVGDFVPSKSNKPFVISADISLYHHIRFKVLFPLYLQGTITL